MDQVQSIRGRPVVVRAVIARLLHPGAVAVIAVHLTLLGLGWWALSHAVPDTLVLNIMGHGHMLSEVHRRVIDRAVDIGLLVPSVFLVEYLWMGWADSSVRHLLLDCTPSSWSDISCYLFALAPASTLVSAVMSFGVIYASADWVRNLLTHATGIHASLAAAPAMIQVAALLVLYTLLDYWSHRLDHTRVFWPLHRFHHSAESFSILTAARIHPAVFTAVITTTLPGVLLGATPGALANLALLITVLRLVIHSRIDSDFGWVGRWLIQSPVHHRLHHSFNRMPVNAGLTPIWDRLFGTWREAPPAPMRIGTPTPYRQGAWIGPDIWRDYCEFWSGLGQMAYKRLSKASTISLRPLGYLKP